MKKIYVPDSDSDSEYDSEYESEYDSDSTLEERTLITTLEHPKQIIDILSAYSNSIVEQKSIAWYEMRGTTIGASEIGKLIPGPDNVYTYVDIFMDRFAPTPFSDFILSLFDYGNFFEEVSRKVVEYKYGYTILETGSIEGFCNPQRFSPDGITIDKAGTPIICEFKTPPTRKYKAGFISKLYLEQVMTGLYTFYKKYSILAKGHFTEVYLRPCLLENLKPKSKKYYTNKIIHTDDSFSTPIYLGYVEIIPKYEDHFLRFLKTGSGVDNHEIKKSNDDNTEFELDEFGFNDDEDSDERFDRVLVTSSSIDYEAEYNKIHDLLTNQAVGFDVILKHVLSCKEKLDKLYHAAEVTGDPHGKIKEQITNHQSFEFIYHDIDKIEIGKSGYYVGYKVFRLNEVFLELDMNTLEAELELRNSIIKHTDALMKTINNFLKANTNIKFNKRKFKKWLTDQGKSKSFNRDQTDVRNVTVSALKDALDDEVFL